MATITFHGVQFTSYMHTYKIMKFVSKKMVCAGRWWGSTVERPVLAMHGLFDNAASFDLLAPHLDAPSLLAIDLPGHGFSSHFPQGMTWNYTMMLTAIRYLIKNYFKWPKVSLMGHSYGSTLALSYAGIYPSETDLLITLDCSRSENAMQYKDTVSFGRRNVNRLLTQEAKLSPKPMSYAEILEKMSKGRKGKMPIELIKVIASRSVTNIGSAQYVFNEDLRMSVPSYGRHTICGYDAIVDQIRCSVLNIVATDGVLIGESMAQIRKHAEVMAQNCQLVHNKVVHGSHHVHMDNPKEVATAVNNFLASANLLEIMIQ